MLFWVWLVNANGTADSHLWFHSYEHNYVWHEPKPFSILIKLEFVACMNSLFYYTKMRKWDINCEQQYCISKQFISLRSSVNDHGNNVFFLLLNLFQVNDIQQYVTWNFNICVCWQSTWHNMSSMVSLRSCTFFTEKLTEMNGLSS